MDKINDFEYKKQVLTNFFNKLEAEHKIENLTLTFKKFHLAGNHYDIRKQRISMIINSKTTMEDLIWTLAHEYKHAIQNKNNTKKEFKMFSIKLIVSVITVLTLLLIFPKNEHQIFVVFLYCFFGYFVFPPSYKRDRINREKEADLFANQIVGGGEFVFKKHLGLIDKMNEYSAKILGMCMHPSTKSRYESSKGYPINQALIDELSLNKVES